MKTFTKEKFAFYRKCKHFRDQNKKYLFITVVIVSSLTITTGCNKNSVTPNGTSGMETLQNLKQTTLNYDEVNLVADTAGFNAQRIDHKAQDLWGVAIAPDGELYISTNDIGGAVVFDREGLSQRSPIDIPLNGVDNGSAPSGAVYNYTNSFVNPKTHEASKAIFSTEDGIVASWTAGNKAETVINHSATGAVYKGVIIAQNHGENFLYVANLNAATVEVYDANFNLVSSSEFKDPSLPAGFAPFGIDLIDGKIYVAYAEQNAAKHDDQPGHGLGYVDIFNTNGSFVKRFASQGPLNAPWGITEIEGLCGSGENILVGNFGDGHINVYDNEGNFKGQLMNGSNPIAIDGLWNIFYLNGDPRLYFTAGPDNEAHGLFGYLNKR